MVKYIKNDQNRPQNLKKSYIIFVYFLIYFLYFYMKSHEKWGPGGPWGGPGYTAGSPLELISLYDTSRQVTVQRGEQQQQQRQQQQAGLMEMQFFHRKV